MKGEIEFLKPYKEKTALPQPLKILTGGVIGALIIYCILMVAIISYWGFLRKEKEKIEKQIEVKKSQINQLRKKESLQVLLKQRLGFLTKEQFFQPGKFPYFLNILSSLQPNVDLLSIQIFENKIEIRGSASNIIDLSGFLEKLETSSEFNVFPNIILDSLARNKDGSYNFSVSLEFKVNGKT